VITSHTAADCAQAQALNDVGHVPDKVIMLDGPHALLLDRVKCRRIDYSTGWWLEAGPDHSSVCPTANQQLFL
jgi:hypothetical protein